MDLGDQAAALARFQDAFGFRSGKHARLTEDVTEFRKLFLRNSWDHLVAKEPKIRFPILPILGGQCVGAQEGGRQIHGVFLIQTPDHPELLQLRLQIQSVAALGLRRGDAKLQHLVQRIAGFVEKLILSGLPGGLHGGEDASSRRQDLQITHAVKY